MVSKGHSGECAFQVPGTERSLEWLGTANQERKQEVRDGEEDKPQRLGVFFTSALPSTWYIGDAPQTCGENEQ